MRMERNSIEKYDYKVAGKKVFVYPSTKPDRPIIYLNTYSEEGERVIKALRASDCPDFSLVEISGLNWDHDMAPWDIQPISAGDTPCTGGADEYLQQLIEDIIPKAEEHIQGRALWRGITGYSLAGLFAIYSLYQTEIFSRAASMSGSLWFPHLKEFIFSHEMKETPECIYFSLGDAECKTKNPYLKIVQECTENIEEFYRDRGISTTFQLNPGGHFQNGVERCAAGIRWILDNEIKRELLQ